MGALDRHFACAQCRQVTLGVLLGRRRNEHVVDYHSSVGVHLGRAYDWDQ